MAESDMFAPGASSPGKLPNVMDLIQKIIADVSKTPMVLVAGVGVLGLSFVGVFAGLILVYGGMFLGMLPGLMADDEDLAGLGAMAGGMIGTFLFVVGLLVATAPMQASLERAVWKYLKDGEPLTIMAPFSTFTHHLGSTLLLSVVIGALTLLGLMMCYLPAILVGALVVFARPMVHVHDVPVFEAIRRSAGHVMANPSWHLGFFFALIVMGMIGGSVPVIGPMALAVVAPWFVLLAYRDIFGDGEEPRDPSMV